MLRDNDIWTRFIYSLLSSTQVLSASIHGLFQRRSPLYHKSSDSFRALCFYHLYVLGVHHYAHIILPLAHPMERHMVDRPRDEDTHAKLMKMFPEVPMWWYWDILVSSFVVVIAVERWPAGVPV